MNVPKVDGPISGVVGKLEDMTHGVMKKMGQAPDIKINDRSQGDVTVGALPEEVLNKLRNSTFSTLA